MMGKSRGLETRSILLMATTSGRANRRRCGSNTLSWGSGALGSTSHTTTSASAKAVNAACTRTWFKTPLGSIIPGVSRKRSWTSGRLRMPNRRWRVVWGLGEVMDSLHPKSRLSKVDLPTLGTPMSAM